MPLHLLEIYSKELGDQLSMFACMYILAKQYCTSFSLPLDRSPRYLFLPFLKDPDYKQINELTYTKNELCTISETGIQIAANIDVINTLVYLKGFTRIPPYLSDYLPILKNMFRPYAEKYKHSPDAPRKVAVFVDKEDAVQQIKNANPSLPLEFHEYDINGPNTTEDFYKVMNMDYMILYPSTLCMWIGLLTNLDKHVYFPKDSWLQIVAQKNWISF